MYMEWFWSILTSTILFLVLYRVIWIRGYKAGAGMVLTKWKQSFEEDELDAQIDEHN